MPLVRAVEVLKDGIRIVLSSGAEKMFRVDDLTVKQKEADQAALNTAIASRLTDSRLGAAGVYVHVESLEPFRAFACVADAPPEDGWWLDR